VRSEERFDVRLLARTSRRRVYQRLQLEGAEKSWGRPTQHLVRALSTRDDEVDVSRGALDAVEREREAAYQRESEPLGRATPTTSAMERTKGFATRDAGIRALNRLRGPSA
jgi:hypothetical protein